MPSLVTVDAVRDQLIQLGRDDIDDATIEAFLASARWSAERFVAAGDDDVSSTTTRHNGRPRTRRPPWNGDAFEEPTTTRTPFTRYQKLPRRQQSSSAHGREAGRCEGGVVDAVQIGQLYRNEWASESSPFVVSGRERPREGFSEKFRAMHAIEEERVRRFRMGSARGRECETLRQPTSVLTAVDVPTRRRAGPCESDAGDGEDCDGAV